MMKKVLTTMVLMALIATTSMAQSAKKIYDEEINPLEQIDQAVNKAKAEGKFVVCQVGGNWCPWCLRFADFVSKDADITQMIDDNFLLIHVNYRPNRKNDEGRKQLEQQMMQRLNNPGRFGYPVFVVLNTEGQVIHIQDSGFLEEGQSYSKDKVLQFFKNWTPKAVGK